MHERNVLTPKGVLLPAYQVGLGLAYPKVRDSMTPEFRAYLDTREPWFEQLKDYRDSLAHRIPLYIPPFTLDRPTPTPTKLSNSGRRLRSRRTTSTAMPG